MNVMSLMGNWRAIGIAMLTCHVRFHVLFTGGHRNLCQKFLCTMLHQITVAMTSLLARACDWLVALELFLLLLYLVFPLYCAYSFPRCAMRVGLGGPLTAALCPFSHIVSMVCVDEFLVSESCRISLHWVRHARSSERSATHLLLCRNLLFIIVFVV